MTTTTTATTTLYLDQNYLSGIAKRKPAFTELEPVLREAVATGAIRVLESKVCERPALGCDLHLRRSWLWSSSKISA